MRDSETEQKTTEKSTTSSIEKNKLEEEFPFKIGLVMRSAFREALSRGLLNSDLSFLESNDACKLFKTRGYKVVVCSASRPNPTHGVNRFAKDPVILNGQNYWITTQVYKEGLPALLSYLEMHGMSKSDVVAICKGEKTEATTVIKEHPAEFSFRDFLRKTMCRSSASSYASSFKDLENILLKARLISSPLSSKLKPEDIESIRVFLSSDKDFVQYNKEHHYSLSASWKKFEEYLTSLQTRCDE